MQIATHGILASSASAAASFSNVKSLDFDGVDDYVAISSSSGLAFTGDFSLVAWIKADSIGSNMYVVDTSTSATTGNGYSFRVLTTGKVRFWSYSASHNLIDSATTLSAGTWYHIAVVHNSTQNKIYINGSLDATQNWTTGHNTSNTANLRIGSSQILGGAFNGHIDEVAFFNSDQSSNIATIYNSGSPADLTSLSPVSWFRNGDGDTFPTLTDNGSGSNNGTMTNMTSGDIVTDVP